MTEGTQVAGSRANGGMSERHVGNANGPSGRLKGMRVGWLVAVLAISACTTSSRHPQPVPVTHVVRAVATITVDSNQRTETMRIGQTQLMYLAPNGHIAWDAVKLSRAGIVALSSVRGGYPALGYSATLTAIHAGAVRLTTQTDMSCIHVRPACELPTEVYSVTVTVAS